MRVTDPRAVAKLLVSTVDGPLDETLVSMVASSGCLLKGHFRLQSGLHSPYFLRFGQLTFRQADADKIAALFVALVQPPIDGLVVLGAETSARYLASALGRVMGTPVVLAKVDERRRPTTDFTDEKALEKARGMLIATDILTTGESVRPLVNVAQKFGNLEWVRLIAFATLEPGGHARVFQRLAVDGHCLLQARWAITSPNDCELCQAGTELVPAFEFV